MTVEFDGAKLFANLSLELPHRRTLITGENGTGKTTLLLLAAGLLAPRAGDVKFNGNAVATSDFKARMGISASKVTLPPFITASELLQFHCNMHKCPMDNEWPEALGLKPFLHKKVQDLSLGNYKKLSIVSAAMHNPQLLLLDEPTNGLDEHARVGLLELLNRYSGQLVVASHELTSQDLTEAASVSMAQIKTGHL